MLTNWDLLAIIIALLGCLTVMGLFWKQNIELTKEVNRLRMELRKALKV
jgi:hypothetical protein